MTSSVGHSDKSTVLFLCTHNSARSQMAEGILRAYHGDRYIALSAGTEATSVKPEAIAVMRELGIDISDQSSKKLDRYLSEPIDWVVTVCDAARESCPVFPGATSQVHRSFEDPSDVVKSPESRLDAFRKSRDEIKAWIDLAFGPKRP